jgi:hypothetical protein
MKPIFWEKIETAQLWSGRQSPAAPPLCPFGPCVREASWQWACRNARSAPKLSQGWPEGGPQDTLQGCGDPRPRSVAAPATAGKGSGATCGRAGSARP